MKTYKFNFYFKINWFYNYFLKRNKLKPSEISLYFALLHLATNSEGIANIKKCDLVKITGISRNCVENNIQKLVKHNLIKIVNKNCYEIVCEDNNTYNNRVNNHTEKTTTYNFLFDDLDNCVI